MKSDYGAMKAKSMEHLDNPESGDYWHEMFSPVLVVVAVHPYGLVICDKIVDVDDKHWAFDLDHTRLVPHGYLRERFTYETMPDKTWCDVMPRKMEEVCEEYQEPFNVLDCY